MLDLTTAFDIVNHNLLINKLWHYGIRETARRSLSSYLMNRIQYADLNKFNSSLTNRIRSFSRINSRSVTILNFNDIANADITIPRLYADNTCFILIDHSLKRLEHSVNNELTKVCLWAKRNKLTLNPSKSQVLIISPTIKKAKI